MTISEALRIVQSLADGQCPVSGKTFSPDSPYQQADVVRALIIAARALEREENRERRNRALPEQAGKPWGEEEDRLVCEEYDAGRSIADLARIHQRTRGAIQSRLEKLGKIVPELRG